MAFLSQGRRGVAFNAQAINHRRFGRNLDQWTVGLAAAGLVGVAATARAQEKPGAVQTALANTTLSGYVSTSANVNLTDNPAPASSMVNGFYLDVVKLSLVRPEEESPWAAGYRVDLLFGPDAAGYDPGTTRYDFAVQQAYATLRTPVGTVWTGKSASSIPRWAMRLSMSAPIRTSTIQLVMAWITNP